MDRLDELYAKMVDEAPRFFPESNKPYILELAREYATEVARHNLERAASEAYVIHTGTEKTSWQINDIIVDKQSITSLEIELI